MSGTGSLDLRFSPAAAILLLCVVLLVEVLLGSLGACLIYVARASGAVAKRHNLVAGVGVGAGCSC